MRIMNIRKYQYNKHKVLIALGMAGLISASSFSFAYAEEIAEDAEVETEALTSLEAEALTETERDKFSLPVYQYNGGSTMLAAICTYMEDLGKIYLEGDVMVPAPLIFAVDDQDPEDMKVYGNFWIFWYNLDGDTLKNVSGGEHPGVFHMKRDGDAYEITSFEQAGDGEEYAEDIRRFCAQADVPGVEDLEDLYFETNVETFRPLDYVRSTFLEQYVSDNNLPIYAYQDYGWDPVELHDVKLTFVDDALYRDTGEMSFLIRCGNMDFSIEEWEAGEVPTQNGTSNFEACEGQRGFLEDTIDLFFDEHWHIFEKIDYPKTGEMIGGSDGPTSIFLAGKISEEDSGWGSTAKLYLKSNPSTGFEWTVSQSEELFQITETYASDEYDEDEAPVGVPGEQIFELIPLSPGTTEVTFVYQRPWEEEEDAWETRSYTFEVNDDLKVRCVNASAAIEGAENVKPVAILPVVE